MTMTACGPASRSRARRLMRLMPSIRKCRPFHSRTRIGSPSRFGRARACASTCNSGTSRSSGHRSRVTDSISAVSTGGGSSSFSTPSIDITNRFLRQRRFSVSIQPSAGRRWWNPSSLSTSFQSSSSSVIRDPGRAPSWLARVTLGEHLPIVIIRLVPVDDPAAVLHVYLVVHRSVDVAPERDALCADSAEYRVELAVVHAKAIVDPRKRLAPLVEIDGEALVDENRREGPDARIRPRHAEEFREQFRGRELVARGHHEMIEMNGHGSLHLAKEMQVVAADGQHFRPPLQ